MDRATTKAGLLDWARRERAGWELLVAEVGEARMLLPGPMGDWTFRDLLAHLDAWQRYEQAPLELALTGGRPAPPWPADLNPTRDQDRINQFVYEATRHRPPADVLRDARQTWDRLEEGLAALPDVVLADPGPVAWMDGKPLGPTVLREATGHYHQDHEADVRAWLATQETAAARPIGLGRVEHLNPDGLPKSPAFSNVVAVSGNVKTVYVGGQNAVDADGTIVGACDIGAQADQVFANLRTALAAAGADLHHVVTWTIHVVQGQPLHPGFAAFQRAWGDHPNPPAITVAIVSALAVPDALVEVDAVAVVPQE